MSLIEKILDAPILEDPFPHIEVHDFLDKALFERVTHSWQLNPVVWSTVELIDWLSSTGYEITEFPGCVQDKREYLDGTWVPDPLTSGKGLAFRMTKYLDTILEELPTKLMRGEEFHRALETKFGLSNTHIETHIQKYLSGYEISPHPDVRRKALTFMLNINTSVAAEYASVHTMLLRLKPKHRGQYEYWNQHHDVDRGWLPWSWAEPVKTISKNNTLVMFPTSSYSIHAVKLDYDHVKWQRTQVYGNLWYLR